MYKIMFSAGEASGDLHGANLARAILQQSPDAYLFGLGGPKMEQAGVKLTHHMEDYAVMGFWEVLVNLRRLFRLRDELVHIMEIERPDILVLIDYPDFNWRLASKAKELGIKIFSFIPPSAWAWRKGRARKVAQLADRIVAIFPFEMEVYRQAGAHISFEGNPLVELVKPAMSKAEAEAYFKMDPQNDNIVLLPGSRKQELAKLLLPMLEGAQAIALERPRARFYLPIAPGIKREEIEAITRRFNLPLMITTDYTYDLMANADLAIATSGTVTLEASLLGLPCIVLYKMSAVTYRIAQWFVKIPFFSLPNIIAGRQIIPELLQDAVTPSNILKYARRMYQDSPERPQILQDLSGIRKSLGERNVASRVAKIILETAQA